MAVYARIELASQPWQGCILTDERIDRVYLLMAESQRIELCRLLRHPSFQDLFLAIRVLSIYGHCPKTNTLLAESVGVEPTQVLPCHALAVQPITVLATFLVVGWGGRIRTYAYSSQSAVSYRLTTPQYLHHIIWY